MSVLLLGAPRVFPGWSQLLSLLPGITGTYLRRSFYKRVLPYVGDDVWIGFATVFSSPSITIGENVYIGVGCMLGDVEIGDDVLIGSHVSVINGNRQHGIDRLDRPIREQLGEFPRIRIGRDSWLGDRAIVMKNIGDHCVVGSGAVVTKDVEDYLIVAGNPARQIGSRSCQDEGNVEATPK